MLLYHQIKTFIYLFIYFIGAKHEEQFKTLLQAILKHSFENNKPRVRGLNYRSLTKKSSFEIGVRTKFSET